MWAVLSGLSGRVGSPESFTDVLSSGTHLGMLLFAEPEKHHRGAAEPSIRFNSLLSRGSAGPDRKQSFELEELCMVSKEAAPLHRL